MEVGTSPPTVSTRLLREPILGFVMENDGSLTPILLSGPAKFWQELRTSVNGAHIRTVEVPGTGIARGKEHSKTRLPSSQQPQAR